MSVEVSYNKQFLLGLIFVILILLVMEVGIKTYEFFTPPCEFMNADVFNQMDFGVKRSMCLDSVYLTATSIPITLYPPNQNFETITINSHGFRGSEFSQVKSDDTFRIFLVGGSTAFGFGSTSDETTISGYLQKEFDRTEQNIEVINAGIGAAWSFSEEFLIEKFLLNYEPDLIVVYDGANDSRYRILEGEEKMGDGLGNYIPNFYRTPYFLNDFVFKFGFSEETEWSESDNELIGPISSTWEKRMQNICNIGKKNNFDVIIALQPMLAVENRQLYGDEKVFNEEHFQKHGSSAIRIYDEMKKSLKTLHGCTVTQDLTKIFENSKKPVYWDDVHITENGNQIVAHELFELILSIVD